MYKLATDRRIKMGSLFTGILLAALGLWLLLPGGALRAQDAAIEYAENGTDPVATYTATDPEGRTVYWSLLPRPMPIPTALAIYRC